MRQQSNLLTENLQLLFESMTKLARTGSACGTESGVLNRVKYVGNTFVFYFGFYFMSPKWTKTKIAGVIEITLSLLA